MTKDTFFEIPWIEISKAKQKLCLSCDYWIAHQTEGNYCSKNHLNDVLVREIKIKCPYHSTNTPNSVHWEEV